MTKLYLSTVSEHDSTSSDFGLGLENGDDETVLMTTQFTMMTTMALKYKIPGSGRERMQKIDLPFFLFPRIFSSSNSWTSPRGGRGWKSSELQSFVL